MLEYRDFVVLIDSGGEDGRGYSLQVVNSPSGEASGSLRIALASSWFQERLAAVGGCRTVALSHRGGGEHEAESWDGRDLLRHTFSTAGEAVAARELGSRLFEALTGEREVYSGYQASLLLAREQGKGLRIRLQCRPPELAALPWEVLFDPHLKRDYLCLSRETPVVRHLLLGLPVITLSLAPPVRILAMVGASEGLDARRERQLLETAIEHLTESGAIEISWIDGGKQALGAALESGPWHVFHFIGHGRFDGSLGEGTILVAPERAGAAPDAFAAGDLATLLADVSTLKLVVLNSCQSGLGSGGDALSSVGAALAGHNVPAVLSMQRSISDRAAIELARCFYDRLAAGDPVEAAVADARRAIKLARSETVEWAAPLLHLRAKDGALFRFDLTQSLFATAPSYQGPHRTGFSGLGMPVASNAEALHGLAILRRKIQRIWIEGVLASALQRSPALVLDMEQIEGGVESPWGAVLESAAGSHRIPAGRTARQIFEEVGGSLLVLGEPGSGKTVALLELARGLLAACEEDPNRPVPIVFPLSSWGLRQLPLAAWLVDELAVKYLIPKKIGSSWLSQIRILPLLDGLDEVREDARAGCVEAINAFASQTLLGGIAVSCRLHEYLRLPVRLGLHAAIRLLPVGEEQVRSYVRAAGAPLAALAQALDCDSGLLAEMRSPLMLGLAVQAYRDLQPASIAQTSAQTLAARRRNVMAAYVDRMYRRAGLRVPDV